MDINGNNRRHFILGLGATTVAATIMASFPVAAKKKVVEVELDVPKLGPSNIPNAPLWTHEDKEIKFYDDVVNNKILLINMMYADCMDSCPLTTSNLMQVQRLIAKKMQGLPIQMCSITLRPEEDTVTHLSHYVKQHHIPPGWLFLTGKPEMIKLVRYSMGFYDPDPALDGLSTSHTGMLRVGNNKLSRWSMAPALAKPDQILKLIEQVT